MVLAAIRCSWRSEFGMNRFDLGCSRVKEAEFVVIGLRSGQHAVFYFFGFDSWLWVVNVLVNLNCRELAGYTLSVNELLIEKEKSCFRTMISASHNNETMQCQLFYWSCVVIGLLADSLFVVFESSCQMIIFCFCCFASVSTLPPSWFRAPYFCELL